MKDQFALWLTNWAMLLDALIGIFTLGYVATEFYSKAASWYMDTDFDKQYEELTDEELEDIFDEIGGRNG